MIKRKQVRKERGEERQLSASGGREANRPVSSARGSYRGWDLEGRKGWKEHDVYLGVGSVLTRGRVYGGIQSHPYKRTVIGKQTMVT